MQIVWLKRDLRLQDQAPLCDALDAAPVAGKVLPLYIWEPEITTAEDYSSQHAHFITETLSELKIDLASIGGALLECEGSAVDVLKDIQTKVKITRIVAYQETGNLVSYKRDLAVHAWCKEEKIKFVELPQHAVQRGSDLKKNGFQFEQYREDACNTILEKPAKTQNFATVPEGLQKNISILNNFFEDKPARLSGGRFNADKYLQDFLRIDKLRDYPKAISSPNTAVSGCSRLSPYLAFGIISDREIFHHLNSKVTDACALLGENASTYLKRNAQFYADRLNWRCGYLQAFERYWQTEVQCDLTQFEGVREENASAVWLAAWKTGNTGYPMIDAAMRMLACTGWINMRLRGLVVSFAVNELWLPWRQVGLHLAREFLDYEPAIHWNQIQIHSGSSRLGAPLTYNAVKQAKDHDAQGLFVKKWIPELTRVPLDFIFSPSEMDTATQIKSKCTIGKDYPYPIVDLKLTNASAKKRVYALRTGKNTENAPEELAIPKKEEKRQLDLF